LWLSLSNQHSSAQICGNIFSSSLCLRVSHE
jgi:hypothetical protein